MKRYMLDTDIASYLIRGDRPEITEAFTKNFRDICISAITAAELQYGAQKRNSAPLTKKVLAFCALIPIVEWDASSATVYGKLRAELEIAGNTIGAMDMLIAASAMASNAILVTNNTAHFSRIQGLRFESWAK